VTMIVFTGKLDNLKGCSKCSTSATDQEQRQNPLNVPQNGETRG
jgi:hypothetical protein